MIVQSPKTRTAISPSKNEMAVVSHKRVVGMTLQKEALWVLALAPIWPSCGKGFLRHRLRSPLPTTSDC